VHWRSFKEAIRGKFRAHYVMIANGDIYQAWSMTLIARIMYGRQTLDHRDEVGSETDALAAPQPAASAALIRWLLWNIRSRAQIFFVPRFPRPATAGPEEPVVRTSSSAHCTRKPRSLPGSRPNV